MTILISPNPEESTKAAMEVYARIAEIWAKILKTLPPLVAAAAISGLPADVIVFPFSRIKTVRMTQGALGNPRGLLATISSIYKTQGPQGFFRGLSPVLASAVPGTAAFFIGMQLTEEALGKGPAASALQGVAGQVAGSAVWVPSEVVKELRQMMAMKPELQNLGTLGLLRHIIKSEGLKGLYRGFLPQLLTFGPFNSLGLMLANLTKTHLIKGNDSTARSFAANALGFGAAAAVTTPIDVVKTRLQVGASNPDNFPYRSIAGCFRHTLAREGWRAFASGLPERTLWLGGRQAIAVTGFSTAFGFFNRRYNAGTESSTSPRLGG